MFSSNLALLPHPNKSTITNLFFLSLLCASFYLLGIYTTSNTSSPFTTTTAITTNTTAATAPDCLPRPNLTLSHHDSTDSPSPPLDFETHHFPTDDAVTNSTLLPIPSCPANFTDYCPCQDPTRERAFHSDTVIMFHRERHCPPPDERPRCRVPRRKGYRTPFRWPKCRDQAWFANVPSKRLSTYKKDQNWVRIEGDLLVFPGGGTSFPGGVKGYVTDMAKLVPLKTGGIRTVLDTGCGVASFGGHLLDYNIMTMSIAPRDVHEAQVQFALERGLPAMLGVMSVHRLPYPSRSFDMAHCARCLIKWADHGGLYLLEIDRVLRPGGYWVLSGPPIFWKQMYKGWKRSMEDLKAEQKAIEDLAKQLFWKKIREKGPIAVWQKPSNHFSYPNKSMIAKTLDFCEISDCDAAWYMKMGSCICPLPKVGSANEIAGGTLKKWPERLSAVPPRINNKNIQGITDEFFHKDNQIWKQRLAHYELYVHSFSGGRYRNVMDMNAGLGGFAAALIKYPGWVMNVVPANGKNDTLGIIYERGLIGTYMDWCEAFSTYPRTYDLIHADGIFSLYLDKCDIIDIVLEMDRILRPEGAVIIRDHVDIIVKAKSASDRLKWQSRIVHSEKGPFHPEKLLIIDNSLGGNIN